MTVLDWSAGEHVSRTPTACRHCGTPTQLVDAAGRPSHKTCAQGALDALAGTPEPSTPAREPEVDTPSTRPGRCLWSACESPVMVGATFLCAKHMPPGVQPTWRPPRLDEEDT